MCMAILGTFFLLDEFGYEVVCGCFAIHHSSCSVNWGTVSCTNGVVHYQHLQFSLQAGVSGNASSCYRKFAQMVVLPTGVCSDVRSQRATGIGSTPCSLTLFLQRFPNSFLGSANTGQYTLLLCSSCFGIHNQPWGTGVLSFVRITSMEMFMSAWNVKCLASFQRTGGGKCP